MQVIFELVICKTLGRLLAVRLGAALLLALIGLTGCASGQLTSSTSTTEPQETVADLNPDQTQTSSDAELALDPDLPKLDLDAQMGKAVAEQFSLV